MRARIALPLSFTCILAAVAVGTRVGAGPTPPPAASAAPLGEGSLEYLIGMAARLAKQTSGLGDTLKQLEQLHRYIDTLRTERRVLVAKANATTDPTVLGTIQHQIELIDAQIAAAEAQLQALNDKARAQATSTAATRLDVAAASIALGAKADRLRKDNVKLAQQMDDARGRADHAVRAATTSLLLGITSGVLRAVSSIQVAPSDAGADAPQK